MYQKPLKALALTFGTLLVAAPLAFGEGQQGQTGTSTGTTGQQSQYGSQQSGSQTGTSGTTSQSGMSGMQGMTGETITATVESIDEAQGTVKIRPETGDAVELQIPQSMLSGLQAGDSVEVSIRKAQHASSGSQSSQPSGSMGTSPPSGSGSGSQQPRSN